MTTLRHTVLVALFLLAGSLVAVPEAAADHRADQIPVTPCYNGVFPLNPYVDNCAVQPRPHRVLGSAPDQTALLNCSIGSEVFRAQCISLFVNGGYGLYPGAVLAPGYHP